jgi:hypothetical protein
MCTGWGNMKYLSIVVLLCLLGCATGPIEETKSFISAVAAVKSATDAILDDFNVAERNQFSRQRHGAFNLRTADEAYYYSTLADAPSTRQFRRGILVIQEYSELLRILVDGTNVAAVHAQAESLANSIAGLVADARVKAAFAAFSPILDQLVGIAGLAEAKRLALAGEKPMRILLASLRDAAPKILDGFLIDIQASSSATQAEVLRRSTERRLIVANDVVMLDRLDEAFVRAYEQPNNPVTLSLLVKATNQLESDLQAARKTLAIIRNPA